MQFRKYVITLLFILPFSLFSQDITGLWKGSLYNDTTKQFYKYEIGISKEKGKYTGFSHTWFLLDDKQYYGVKKVKIKVAEDGKIIIEDDGLIANNYPVAPSKNVRQLNVLILDESESEMKLTGSFTTNRTKEYRPLTGTINLQRKNDFWQSALVPHLQELGKEKELSFVREEIETLAKLELQKKNAAELSKREQEFADKEKAKIEIAKQLALKQKETERENVAKLIAKQEAEVKLREEKEAAEKEIAKQLVIKQQEANREIEAKLIAKQEAEAKAAAEKERKETEIANLQAVRLQEAEKEKAKKELVIKEAAAKNLAEKEKAREAFAKQQAAKALEIEKENTAKLLAKTAAEIKTNAEIARRTELAKQQQEEKVKAAQILAQQEAMSAAKKEKEKIELAKQNTIQQQKVENEKAAVLLAKKQQVEKEEAEKLLSKKPVVGQLQTNTIAENEKKTTPVAAIGVKERTTVLQQTVSFTTDSLQLSLYDNGEVDGDTVSVLMNGQLILEKQGLSTTAIKKTIYIPSNIDRVELVMYAESLGSIPPNTGLLVIKDGKSLYEIRFSGDLQKNASIVFNRKKE